MIITLPIVLRLVAIVFVTVLLQLGFFAGIPLLGTTANVVPVVVVSLGLLGGAVTGGVSGFCAGLLLDVTVGGIPGVASLSLMAAGYLAGRWREGYDIVSSLVPPLLCGALTGVAVTIYGAMQLTLGIEAPISVMVLREILAQALLGAILAVPLFPLIRWLLRPAIVEGGTGARARTSPDMLGGSRPGISGIMGGGTSV
jgi:rod shape-determining protein MreD